METLKNIKEQLVAQVQGQMGDLRKVDAKELGEVIDMIKDLSKTMYYCSIIEAMEDAKENEQMRGNNNTYYYMEKYMPMDYPYREHDYYDRGRMYYSDGGNQSNSGNNNSNTNQSSGNSGGGGRSYYEERYPIVMRDDREGRSGSRRRMYMESKQMSADTTQKIQNLEEYMRELTSDIMEMIQDASPEEKAVLQKKMNVLASKMQNV